MDLRNRESLLESIPHGGVGAEIGVADGEFSAAILAANAPRKLYLIDCWKCPDHIAAERRTAVADEYEREYRLVLGKFRDDMRVYVMRDYSIAASARFVDGFFDWVYIDADHGDAANDIRVWVPKVRAHGWMLGHDYVNEPDGTSNPVQLAVDWYAQTHNIPVLLTEEPVASWAFQRAP